MLEPEIATLEKRQPTVRFSTDLGDEDRTRSGGLSAVSGRARRYSYRSRLFGRSGSAGPITLDDMSKTVSGSTEVELTDSESSERFEALPSGESPIGSPVDQEKIDDRLSHTKSPGDSIPFYTQCAQRYAQTPTVIMLQHYFLVFKNFVLQIREYCADPQGRVVVIDATDPAPQIERISQMPYIENHVSSARYTLYNFLPRQLVFQFSKVANIYFLVVSILQMIPGLSTTGSYTTIIPLALFISIAMAREGYDDYRRHKMDSAENNKYVDIIDKDHTGDGLSTSTIKWRHLKVGDIVTLRKDEWIPADLILLHSNGENDLAYLETTALDGETNLKTKRALPSVSSRCRSENLHSFKAKVHSEAPNQDLYNYEGKIEFDGEQMPLTNDQIIYRGSILRNTSSLTALVLFTGEESKIRLNASRTARAKRPSIQGRVNRIVILIVAFVLGLCIFCTCGYYVWHSQTETKLWYLNNADSISFLPIFVSFLILYNTMVPLSLYVSMEIVKIIQQLLLQQDIDMYDERTDTPAEARTSTINEELGQISHIFTDKTGTLTDNDMVFRRLSVAGHSWLHGMDYEHTNSGELPFLIRKQKKRSKKSLKRSGTDVGIPQRGNPRDNRRSLGSVTPRTSALHYSSRKSNSNCPPHIEDAEGSGTHSTREMLQFIQDHPHTVFSRHARFLLLSMALCHTALPELEPGEEIPHFSATSPDETALVNAASQLGYIMTDRNAQTVTLKTFPSGRGGQHICEVYKIHDTIEFSSARKRMSVVVEMPDGRFCIMCKGADSFLLERMRLRELARHHWTKVQAQVSKRQSVEADRILARKSMTRPSLSRPSMSGRNRLDMIRDLDDFLDNRRDNCQTYNDTRNTIPTDMPPDIHSLRHSIAFGEIAMPLERIKHDLVDEALSRNEGAIFERTFQHLHSFAAEGLRVLLYGHRFFSSEEYHSWKKLYHEATTSFENRQAKIERAGALIEVNLELTGATAIEDKLQIGVPQSIEKLRRAGINIWMLTGDKKETAINIGHSAGLLKEYSTTIVLDQHDPELRSLMATRFLQISDQTLAHTAIVVDGATLGHIEENSGLLALFLDLAVKVDTVICCRASPAQKASLVRHVRKTVQTSITLAIGDGANDIAMIREAHVGIGITGKEGLQAARSSDYSIAGFRFLVKLLLVHGRWNYMRYGCCWATDQS